MSHHIPTPHANIEGQRGEGHSWIVCSCGVTGIPRSTMRGAWDAFYDHLEAVCGHGLPRKQGNRQQRGSLQTERLFEP